MSDTAQHQLREKNIGDTAVNGLIAGILAGLVMAAYLVLSGVLSGFSPAVMLGRFDPGMDGRWLIGTLAHLAVSGVYGVIFASLVFDFGAHAAVAAALWLAGGAGLWACLIWCGAGCAAACDRFIAAANFNCAPAHRPCHLWACYGLGSEPEMIMANPNYLPPVENEKRGM